MKTYKHLYEKYISDENIKLAINNVCKHKLSRKEFATLKNNAAKSIQWIKSFSRAEDFKNCKHTPIQIYDGIQRKKRTIIVPKFTEQIVHHMVVNIFKPIVMKSLYEHSYGSVPERGATLGRKRIEKWLKDAKNTKYCLKMDIRKYFDSIPHDILKEKLARIIKDECFISILYEIIDVTENGLPLGFYTSQWLANWYLSDLDHYIKEQLGAKYYIRYMDDMVIFGSNKRKLHKTRIATEDYLNTLGLTLKDNWQIFPIGSRGLDFMGFRFFRAKVTLRKSILRKARRKAIRIHNKDKPTIYDARQMVSYIGWLEQTDTYWFYLKHIKPLINFQYLKRRLSRYDKRMAKCSRECQTRTLLCA